MVSIEGKAGGIKPGASLFDTERIDHLYLDSHEADVHLRIPVAGTLPTASSRRKNVLP